MHFVGSNRMQIEKLIRRTMCSGMNLLLIASFIAAPTSIVLLPTLSFANPLPFPPEWMTDFLYDLKTGKLTRRNLDAMNKKGKGSYKKVLSLINRINLLADQQKSPFRLNFAGLLRFIDPATVGIRLIVIDAKTGKEIGYFYLGVAKYDIDETVNNTSLPSLDVMAGTEGT